MMNDRIIDIDRRLERIENILARIPPLSTFFKKHFTEETPAETKMERRLRLIEDVILGPAALIDEDDLKPGLEHSNPKGE